MKTIDPEQYERIVFFTGAGMSAESGVPTYRGRGGGWFSSIRKREQRPLH